MFLPPGANLTVSRDVFDGWWGAVVLGKSLTTKNYLFQSVNGAMVEKINKWSNKPDSLETFQYPFLISPFSLS